MTEKEIEMIRRWPAMDKEEYGSPFRTFDEFFEKYKNLDLIKNDDKFLAKRMWIYYDSASKKLEEK